MDSVWRDREEFPNENSYQLKPTQVETWFKSSRAVRAFPQNPSTQPLEFVNTINIKYLVLPYSEAVSELPIVFIDFRSMRYKDIHLINSIDGRQAYEKFICVPEKVQNDRNGNPLWIHYKCHMEQTMRFERGEPVIFEITTRDGSVLPQLDTDVPENPDPTKQTLVTFEITTFLRDNDYDNHLVEPHST